MSSLMHIGCNDDVIQLRLSHGLLYNSTYYIGVHGLAYSVCMRCFEVVEFRHACFVHLVLQYSPHTLVIKSGEFAGPSRGRMNSGVSLLAKTAFLSCVSILTRDIDIAMFVHLSVRPLRSGILWKELKILL